MSSAALEAQRLPPWARRLALGSALCVGGLGATVLAGWVLRAPTLIQVLPTLPPMVRNTAACFLLCGAALLILTLNGPRWAVFVCGTIVCIVGSLNIVEIVTGVKTGVNELMGAPYIGTGQVRPGRMAPVTAIGFTLGSLALMASSPTAFTKQQAATLGLIGAVVAAAGFVGMIGFGGKVALAAFHTAAGLFLLGTGMLALAWRVSADGARTPAWLPLAVVIGMLICTLALWRALVLGGNAPFALLPVVVVAAGCFIAPIFGLTVYFAQRAQAQARALRRSEAFLTEAQHLSRTGSFSWRVSTGEIAWSAQLYRIFEFDPAGAVTLARIASRVHPDDIPSFQSVARSAQHGGDLEFDHRLQMPDGSIKYLHMVARGTRDAHGQVEYLGSVQDVTQRRLAEEALGKARADLARVARVTSLGALTASIAHEVNQPLSGILTNANTCVRMLAADPPNVQGALETARRTIRDGKRASDVIKRLRALFVNRQPANESVDLNEATREVIALSLSELQQRRIILAAELAEDLPALSGDRVQLQQVILNLVRNAADAMSAVDDRPRQLLIATQRDGDCVRLSVQDSGTSFEPQAAERLFQAFYTTKPDGMGIGLAVSRSIVESHQGRLWAVPNDGPGATFLLSIPIRRDMPVIDLVARTVETS